MTILGDQNHPQNGSKWQAEPDAIRIQLKDQPELPQHVPAIQVAIICILLYNIVYT